MNIWNQKTLDPPPTTTFKTLTNCKNLIKVINSSTELQDTLINNKFLHAEAAILSRCIYRMKVKLRSDKGMKSMAKLNRALLRYLNIDYIKDLNNFIAILPRKFDSGTYLPTRNLIDYILIRTQGFAKLMSTIADYAREAARYMEDRIFIGHLWKMALMAFAIVARIFVLTRHITKASCNFFNDLLSTRQTFLNTSNYQWLPQDYKFPNKLNDWLNVDWLDMDLSVLTVPINKSFIRFYEDDSDVEFCGEYVDINDDIEIVNQYFEIPDDNKSVEVKAEIKKINDIAKNILDEKIDDLQSEIILVDDDVGECLKEVKVKKLKKVKSKNFLNNINSLEQLDLFIKEENIFRNSDGKLNKCRLKGLDKMQWNMVHKSLKKLVKSSKFTDANKKKKLLEKGKEILQLNMR